MLLCAVHCIDGDTEQHSSSTDTSAEIRYRVSGAVRPTDCPQLLLHCVYHQISTWPHIFCKFPLFLVYLCLYFTSYFQWLQCVYHWCIRDTFDPVSFIYCVCNQIALLPIFLVSYFMEVLCFSFFLPNLAEILSFFCNLCEVSSPSKFNLKRLCPLYVKDRKSVATPFLSFT